MRLSLQLVVAGSLGLLAVTALLLSGPPPESVVRAQDIPAKGHTAYTETIPGSEVKFDMVPIPGGTYLRGSPPDEPGRSEDEGPQHPVTVRPFWMGKKEVTWDEYDLYWKDMGIPIGEKSGADDGRRDRGAITRPTPPYADETFGLGREGYPVIAMTHHAAMQYCRWLSKKTGKLYRLPTEAEWEYACRAGTKSRYFFGDDPAQLGEYAWYAANSEDLTHPVGEKKPNPWGLYDILGNVAEWCIDPYEKDAYKRYPTDKPTLSPVLLPLSRRFPDVARGGGWADKADQLRSAARGHSDKSWIKLDPQRPQSIWWLTSAEFVGIRVVRAVAEQDNLKDPRSPVNRESD